MADHYQAQMEKLAEVGAALCCYMPGAGNPEAWPTAFCDCKYLSEMLPFTSEMTGCCEARQAWRALDVLREKANA